MEMVNRRGKVQAYSQPELTKGPKVLSSSNLITPSIGLWLVLFHFLILWLSVNADRYEQQMGEERCRYFVYHIAIACVFDLAENYPYPKHNVTELGAIVTMFVTYYIGIVSSNPIDHHLTSMI
ncbi:hypothetical protein SASPL_109786 [Salvia splendens]|uniref:Uncharacterized protein n=1 Tax=Salvia splendens TaxID=180675 RepID=A0A8X8YLB9_SALSN|nr:hypothetical protein SASPL_109786 [Salvia splendens]